MGWLWYIAGLFLVILLVALLARSRAKAENKSRRGTEPGQGDQLIDAGYYSGGPGGGHGRVIRVTRDPQQYAKAFVPDAKRKGKQ